MKILVMGAGAIGSVFGAFLAENGNDVSLIGREQYIQAIKKAGLRISGIWGEHCVRNVQCFTSASEISETNFDFVLLSTKSFDTEETVKQVLTLVGPETMIISLQNGLGNIESIARLAGKERTIGARVIFGVVLIAPGHFNITVSADKVLIGAISPTVPADKVEKIAATINNAGISTATTSEIEKFIWTKVLYNCCLNAPSALLDTCYGKLGEFEATRKIIRSIITEVLAVARACGINMGFPDAASYEKILYGELLPTTYAHHASTLQDLKNGKKTEIEALNGAIVSFGREKGISTPVNWTLTQLIHGKEGTGPNPC
jgi:2-dehydropantoate 2-reductase